MGTAQPSDFSYFQPLAYLGGGWWWGLQYGPLRTTV
jgi:hypothetical protein